MSRTLLALAPLACACRTAEPPRFGAGGTEQEYPIFDTGGSDTGDTQSDGVSPWITGAEATIEDWGGSYDWVIYTQISFTDPQGSDNLKGGNLYVTLTEDGEDVNLNKGEPLKINDAQAVLDEDTVSFAVSNVSLTAEYAMLVVLEDKDGNTSNEHSITEFVQE